MKVKRGKPRTPTTPPRESPDVDGLATQLKNTLAVARATYTITIQIVAVAAAAIAALLAIAVEFDSYASIAIGGIALFLLTIQVRAAGQAIAGIILAARRLETSLNIDLHHSAVSPIYGAVAGRRRLALLEKAAREPPSQSTDLISIAKKLSPFSGGKTTTVAIASSVILVALGLALSIGSTTWISALVGQALK